MKSLIKVLGTALLALALPLFAVSASAAELRQPEAPVASLTGEAAPGTGLFAKSLAADEKIVVAGRRGRLGAAIVGGIVAGALIAGAARAHKRRHRSHYYHRDRYESRCDRWFYRCEYGNRRACRKFYRHCD